MTGFCRGWSKVFLFDRSFLLLTQSHCCLPIVTKSFGSAVSPLFCPAFAGSSLRFNYEEEHDWQKVNVSSLFYSMFSSKNNVMYCLLISNFTKPTFQKIMLCYCTQTHFYIYPSISNKKTALVLIIGYNLLNFIIRLFQSCSYTLTDFQDHILIKFYCHKRIQNIFTGYNNN